MATVSVIVPTMGRTHLARTLRSIVEQEPDELIVVADSRGDMDLIRQVCAYFVVDRLLECVPSIDRNYDQLTLGQQHATGSHLAFLDDDDEYLPGALEAMRERACDKPVIFRMASARPTVLKGVEHPHGVILWKKPVLEYGNVGTPTFLVPNQPDKLGVWAPYVDGHAGDFTFITGCAENMGGVKWDERIVANLRPL